MSKFVKKQIVVDAHQWFKNGDHPDDDCIFNDRKERVLHVNEGKIVRYYRDPEDNVDRVCDYCDEKMLEHGWIDTREGGHTVCPGDWIITDIRVERDCHGYRYPCKPDVFKETYDKIVQLSYSEKGGPVMIEESLMNEEMFMCTDCGHKISAKDVQEQNLSSCPNCKSDGMPCSSSDDITIKINWHELMILSMWAERWAVQSKEPMEKTVYSIVERLSVQHTKLSERKPLTLAGQIGQVRDAGYDIETNFPGVEDASIDLKRKKKDE